MDKPLNIYDIERLLKNKSWQAMTEQERQLLYKHIGDEKHIQAYQSMLLQCKQELDIEKKPVLKARASIHLELRSRLSQCQPQQPQKSGGLEAFLIALISWFPFNLKQYRGSVALLMLLAIGWCSNKYNHHVIQQSGSLDSLALHIAMPTNLTADSTHFRADQWLLPKSSHTDSFARNTSFMEAIRNSIQKW